MKIFPIRGRTIIFNILFLLALVFPLAQAYCALMVHQRPFDGADGPYQYEIIDDITLTDQARNREIPIRIYYPHAPGLLSPVLLVSHGIGGSKATGNWVGKFMASHGYICIFMTHFGSDSSLLDLSAGMEGNIKRLQNSLLDPVNTLNRPLDITKVLDSLEQIENSHPALKGRLDLKNIGLTGHSFGAFTTLTVAGGYAEAARKLYNKSYSDPRPKAFLGMSPPGTTPGVDPKPNFNEITRPTMIMTGSNDLDPIVKPPRTAESRLDAYKYMPAGDKYALWIEGAYHHTFGDGRPGLSIDPFARKITRIVLLAFFDFYLKGDEAAQAFLKSDQIEKLGEGKVKFYQK
jgi:predicted dienelactone hydrolase